jgi:uncharacterized membrane protein
MATVTAPLQTSSSKFRLKYVVFGFVGLMIAYVAVHNESFLVNRADPEWEHIKSFRWWLLPHGLAGACAILLGPLQFSDRLRQRFTKMHRVIGRFYIGGALILAPLGAYIQYFEERMGATRSFSLAAVTDAVLLMLTTGIAFGFILKGKVQQHRQWMTRSFAVAIVFLEVRVIGGLTGLDNNPRAIETIVWMCVAFSLLVGDLALQVQEYLRSRPKPKAQVAAA